MSRWVAASICFVSIWLVAELYGQSADDGAIRRQFSAYAAARQRGDSKAQASFYSEDADEWRSVNRRMLKGREEIAKDLGLTANTSRTFRLDIENVVFIKPDVALVDSEYFGGASSPNGHASYLMVKHGGQWLIRAARISRYPEPSPPQQNRNDSPNSPTGSPSGVRVGSVLRSPKKTKDVKPVYPAAARSAGVQGAVVVEVTIDRNGRVKDAKVLRSIPLLDQAALDAVQQWEFAPEVLNGVPVPVIVALSVNFSLP
jgi:TonB family protein